MTNPNDSSPVFKSGYVALVGAPNVGKSTLMNQILQEKVSITAPKPQTTRNRILGIMTSPRMQMIFVDTPGIHRARDAFNKTLVETALAALQEVDVICFVVEKANAGGEVNRFIVEELQKVATPILLVINKIDLLADKSELLPLIEGYRQSLTLHTAIPVSALTGDGVETLTGEIAALLPEGPQYYPEDYLTDQPERFLVAELVREKIFHLLKEEIPYAVAVTVDQFKDIPERNRIDIDATIHVERNSQKGIIIGKQGRMLKEVGRLARADMEVLLGCQVFLSLFVRVQKNWRKNRRALEEFGYSGSGR